MIPLFNTNGVSTSPLGFPMSQNRLAVPTWSYAIEVLPPRQIIELGSAGGGFTMAIAVHACEIGARVISYDTNKPNEAYRYRAHRDNGPQFRVADIWASEIEIASLISLRDTTYLLCDGGDKPRELATFAKYLKPGDVIASHDYDAVHELDPTVPQLERYWPWSEIRKAQGDAVAAANDLEPWMQEHFDLAGWLVYRKRLAP